MVRNLMSAGYSVAGWNRTASRGKALVSEGMTPAASPREAATGRDVIIVCVSDDDALESVLFDEQTGVMGGLDHGALLIDCGTTSQELTTRIAGAAKDRGAEFIDAPITGSKLGAAGGKLTFMVGGPAASVARAQPLFDVMGKHTVHVDERIGAGQASKYCLNMSQAVVLEGILEGYTLARKLGVPVSKMSEIFENSAGKTGVGAFKTPYLQAADYEPHFKLSLMHKDLHIALGEASRLRVPLPLARAVCTLYDQGVAEGMGDEDFLVLARLLERWSGAELRDSSPRDGDPA